MQRNKGAPLEPQLDVAAIVSHLGERLTGVCFVGTGSSAEVWHIRTVQHEYVLRLFTKRPARCGLETEIAIRQRLFDAGAAVAAPVLSSITLPDLDAPRPWVVDRFITGRHPCRGEIAVPVAADIGRTLAALHGLRCSGFGTPIFASDPEFQGTSAFPHAGAAARFELPFSAPGPIDETHPLFCAAPAFHAQLIAVCEHMQEIMSAEKAVLCHADLHEGQFICSENHLAALIDFAEATLLPASWDFASLLYFHGQGCVDHTLAEYSLDAGKRDKIRYAARINAIGIAFHRAARSRLPGKAYRLNEAVSYISKAFTESRLSV